DRKRELARAERQWRNLKEWKWFGFGHTDAIPGDTDLALFCPTCPQPGVNLPDNWEDDEYQWKYFRSFVVDGNFVAAHQQQLRTTDDVWIKDGEGFMTRRAPYFDHLRCTTEIRESLKQPCTCNEHRAVLDRLKPHKGCDVTGIGERQMNVDYGLVQAFNNTRTDQAPKIIVVYDINWQSDGEVLERLFSILNGISTIARTMTLAHRTENVDAHMGDNNFKKMIDMGEFFIPRVPTLCKKWKNVCSSAIDARSDFELLSQSATPEQTELWTASVQTAERLREEGNVEAMDIYNVKGIKVIPQTEIQANLMQAEQEADSGVGVTTWLVAGMKIQEAQLSIPELTLTPTLIIYRAQLVSFIRRQGKKPSGDQRLQINRKRQALRRKADEFQDSFQQLFPAVALDGVDLREIPYGDDVLGDDEDEAYLAAVPRGEVEKMEIFLPSTCPGVLPRQLKTAAKVELKLCIAQAENALEGVRREIGHKSFLFRNNIALAINKQMKTRAYSAVKAADDEVRQFVRVYNQARNAILALGCSEDIAARYQKLLPEQLVALKSIYEPNARGAGTYSLPWFWMLQVGSDSDSAEYMDELYRVNWMRARAKMLRWEEESILIPSEMKWTTFFFHNLPTDGRHGKRCLTRGASSICTKTSGDVDRAGGACSDSLYFLPHTLHCAAVDGG
ncbi:hypothetical protein BDZ97DRAFT_1768347, partial [Flammula alnicola]